MTRPRKFLPGATIKSATEAVWLLLDDHWLFVRGKVYHPAFLLAWPVSMIASHCLWGHVQIAELNPEWKPRA